MTTRSSRFSWFRSLALATAFAIASSNGFAADVVPNPLGDVSTLAGSGSAVVGQGVALPKTAVFFDTLSRKDAEDLNVQIRARQEVLKAGGSPQPIPVPVGVPARAAIDNAPTAAAREPGSIGGTLAVGDFSVLSSHDISASEVSTSQRSNVMEPTTLKMGTTAFYTGNWFAAKSTDSGNTFAYINPYTFFPSVNSGFCCDQVSVYAPTQSMAIWGLQYVKDTAGNTFRIARAIGNAGIANDSWTYWDFTPGNFGLAAGTWLDYPSMTVGSTFLYYSSNAFTQAGVFVGSVVMRIPLADLAAGGSVNFQYFNSTIGTARMTEGAGSTMYWGAHNTTTQFRIHRWDAGSTVYYDDVNLNAYFYLNRDGVANSPDGTNWAARADSRPVAAYLANGVLGFMWTAKQGTGRAKPYVVHARFSEATRALISQADIWNPDVAWMYPSVSPNASGHLGGTLQIGGAASGTYAYPGTAAWVTDAISGPSDTVGQTLYVSSSTNGPLDNKWGDYFSSRRDETDTNKWVGASHTLQGGGTGSSAVPKFFAFGRVTADTTPPTIPSSLTATTASSSQINLSWGASTDSGGSSLAGYSIERCSGVGCSSFSLVTTTASTNYSNTGLSASTSYSYRVRAYDGASNFSGYSNSASATTSSAPDTTPPTIPSSVTATTATTSQINVSWGASTDSGGSGFAGYSIERCSGVGCSSFSFVTTTTSTSYSNTSLSASTSYSYRVRAYDNAGNYSGYSNTASATTLSATDTTPPTIPTSFTATTASSSQINLSWGASTDSGGSGFAGYSIEYCVGVGCSSFAVLVSTTSTNPTVAGLTPSTSYSFRIRAFDNAGNYSGYTSVASAITLSNATDSFPVNCQMPIGWTVPGSAQSGWSVVNNDASEGTCSLKSNAVTDSQKAQIQFVGTFAAGNISFSRKVSSEVGYDCLRFYVDGVQQAVGGTCDYSGGIGASGEVPWGAVSVPISAGTHTLIWSYEKDSSALMGQDAAWIDAVVLPAGTSGSHDITPILFLLLFD